MEQEFRENPKGKMLSFAEKGIWAFPRSRDFGVYFSSTRWQQPATDRALGAGIWASPLHLGHFLGASAQSDLCCLGLCGEMSEPCPTRGLRVRRHCRGVALRPCHPWGRSPAQQSLPKAFHPLHMSGFLGRAVVPRAEGKAALGMGLGVALGPASISRL